MYTKLIEGEGGPRGWGSKNRSLGSYRDPVTAATILSTFNMHGTI